MTTTTMTSSRVAAYAYGAALVGIVAVSVAPLSSGRTGVMIALLGAATVVTGLAQAKQRRGLGLALALVGLLVVTLGYLRWSRTQEKAEPAQTTAPNQTEALPSTAQPMESAPEDRSRPRRTARPTVPFARPTAPTPEPWLTPTAPPPPMTRGEREQLRELWLDYQGERDTLTLALNREELNGEEYVQAIELLESEYAERFLALLGEERYALLMSQAKAYRTELSGGVSPDSEADH